MANNVVPTNFHEIIHKTLDLSVPPQHSVATVVDVDGAHVALGTRIPGGWQLDVNSGYDWTGKGFEGNLRLGKSW